MHSLRCDIVTCCCRLRPGCRSKPASFCAKVHCTDPERTWPRRQRQPRAHVSSSRLLLTSWPRPSTTMALSAVGTPSSVGRAKVKPRKIIFRYGQNRGIRTINRFFRKPLNVFNYMRLFLTSRVTKRSKLSAFFFLVSLSNPLMLARSKKLASGVLLLENEVHIS